MGPKFTFGQPRNSAYYAHPDEESRAGVRNPTTVKRKERQTTMQHMQLENRQRLGFLASLGWTMRRIAEDMGWSSQAISDELRNRRVDSDMPFAERSRTPYDVFIEKHGAQGRAFLDALGIVRIPAKQKQKAGLSSRG